MNIIILNTSLPKMDNQTRFNRFVIGPKDVDFKILCFIKFLSTDKQIFDFHDVDSDEYLTNFYYKRKKLAGSDFSNLQDIPITAVYLIKHETGVMQVGRQKMKMFDTEFDYQYENTSTIFANYITYRLHYHVDKNENKIEFKNVSKKLAARHTTIIIYFRKYLTLHQTSLVNRLFSFCFHI